MPIPDLPSLVEAGGWVFSSAVLAAVLWLIITGKLVPSGSYDREAKRSDAQDARLDTLTDIAREQTGYMKLLLDRQESRGTH